MGIVHFFRARPLSGPRNDAGAVPFGQLTVKGFRAVETNGPLVGNGRTVFFGFWIIKRDVGPQGIVVVADPAHLQWLSDNEVKVEQSTAVNALEKVGLSDRMHFIPDQLSGGQQQRVAIARASAGNRPVLLADEPTGNLDIASGKEVMALFKELCHDEENPISILMVTHDPDLASNADRMLLLNDGQTEASDIRSAWGLDNDGGEEE